MHCIAMRIPRTSVLGNALITSTLHGLPRTVTSKSVVVRIGWGLLLIVVLSLFGAHLADLTNKFLNEGLNTDTDLYGVEFEFPDIFVCHKIPFSQFYTLQAMENKNPRFIQLMKLLNDSRDYFHYLENRLKEEENEEAKEPLSDAHIFWESVSWNELVDVIGHKAVQTFPSIRVGEKSLDVARHVKIVSNYIYYYCFVVSVDSESLQFMNEMVELTVYADEDENPYYKQLMRDLRVNFDFRFGLRVYFGPRGSSPNFESQFVHIRPGYSYDIRLEMLKYEKENISKKYCYNDEVKFVDTFDITKERQLDFMYKSCVQEKKQMAFVEKCNCYNTWLTDGLITKSIFSRFPPCFNLSFAPADSLMIMLYDRFKCLNEFDKQSSIKYYDYCEKQIPCHKVTYFPKWTFMKWPAEDELKKTYLQLIREPFFAMNDSNAVPGWWNMINHKRFFKTKSIFSKTVANIRVRPQEFFSTVVEERLSYPWINYFSDIGGILGLYVGASILTVFEVVEIAHNFARTIFSQKIEQCKHKEKREHEQAVEHANNNNNNNISEVERNGHVNSSFWM